VRRDRLSRLARVSDERLKSTPTPPEYMIDERHLVCCFRCLVLNEGDVADPRWKREWLDPGAECCRAHHSLLETIPASAFREAADVDVALRAISRYRSARFANQNAALAGLVNLLALL
jgi:hypothetical protein